MDESCRMARAAVLHGALKPVVGISGHHICQAWIPPGVINAVIKMVYS
jgi:hypothetical protein